MLTVNCKERADMTEVILCLSAIYSGKPLPPRKHPKKSDSHNDSSKDRIEKKERVGTYRTDGQGIRKSVVDETMRPREAKKLNPNSAAARRRKAAEEGGGGLAAAIPLTRTKSSRLRKPTTNRQQQHNQQGFPQSFTSDDTSGFRVSSGIPFTASEDPFQIGEGRSNKSSRSFFTSKDSHTDSSSQDWGGDFSSENGSGFDNFGSSDDGSRSTSFGKSAAVFLKKMSTPKDISASVPSFTSDGFGNLNFSNFGVSGGHDSDFPKEEGFEATYSERDATTSILSDLNDSGISSVDRHRRKKGLKGFFGKGENLRNEI